MRKFAEATGQLWKYKVWQILTAASMIITFARFGLGQNSFAHMPEGMMIALYFLICTAWFIWWATAIRCPQCKKSPSWYQMTHAKLSSFQAAEKATTTCPICGFAPSTETIKPIEIERPA